MDKIYLSKSRYCRAFQCNKMLWMDRFMSDEKDSESKESVFENGRKVGELAKGLFGKYVNIEYNEDLNVMVSETFKEMKNSPNVINEASFCFDNNFCSVDILKNDTDGVEIYEVKSSTHVTDIYLEDASYQYFVLKSLGYNVKKVCIVYLNKEYIRKGKLEPDKLFNIKDITEIAISKMEEINNKITEINEFMKEHPEEKVPNVKVGIHCVKPYLCDYFKFCLGKLPKNNVFDIPNMSFKTKFKLYSSGKVDFKDLRKEKLNKNYLQQIEFELDEKEPKIDVKEIKKFLESLSYPLYFLDFETFDVAIPEYDYTSPYMQVPFQYSLHYITKENGKLMHKEFLAEANEDPRRKLAERLVKDIPKDLCVLAYNMSFEKSVIKKLAKLYPDLSEHLLNITENMKDLMVPFRKRHYYARQMQGSYSIKYVLPALFQDDKNLDYHNLDLVHNGKEASNTFLSLKNMAEEEQKVLRESLLKYCRLDTYAMVKTFEKLKEEVL
ncbi:MAG: DUF2779 domain-containing protein [Clostridia bacterium]|nr:DUF2779 domain-containing protein [Clostridia bacterium]